MQRRRPLGKFVLWIAGINFFNRTRGHPAGQKPCTGRLSAGESPASTHSRTFGAEEGTRTPTPLRVHGPEPCASANSATPASETLRGGTSRLDGRDYDIYSTSGARGVKPQALSIRVPSFWGNKCRASQVQESPVP